MHISRIEVGIQVFANKRGTRCLSRESPHAEYSDHNQRLCIAAIIYSAAMLLLPNYKLSSEDFIITDHHQPGW